ncbi:tetratricopeptide repeat protein [Mesonia sp.]|uniref:tetratricopeptide repeat protein n=1 Tax=Mesonia sp. TaxID=1960830 RepID=UPI001773119A|nr:tetratricopeptide repeat protein [Mesonia sp.]HIB36093.1 tetratricopeptide repeat protein [Mesonia sp.]HIO26576.1 tetratricopeptide repeat protein [Flavobacteriaceae bacterium]
MHYKSFLSILMIIAASFIGFSQQSAVYTNDFADYNKALDLYNNHQYKAAQTLFKEVKSNAKTTSLESDCAYYVANCAVRLNQSNADELMEDFVQNYPSSTKRNSAYINVANYYFENGQYNYARKWFDEVDESSLSKSELQEFYFNNGYAYFKAGRKGEAKKYLNRVRDSKEYGSQAKYYLGFMAYEGDDYEEANEMFDQVKGENRYNRNLSYFQADMNFKLGKFQEAINLGKEQLENSNALERSELNKIIGESYFNLEQYDQAIPYLQEYRGKRGKWNNTDYYQLGYAYYKQGDYQKAVSEFNKIIDGQNHVAQNAYYHLAESYIELGKKQEALNAFKNASEMDFDKKIQEDAALNYAKLSYEIGNNYKSIPEVLTEFIEKYPESREREEIEELLVDSYVTSKNYEKALNLLESSNDYDDKVVYQKVAYYRGTELYIDGNYSGALVLFNKSLAERNNQTFTAKATYWKAECDYNLENFSEALIGYKEFKGMAAAKNTAEYENIDYNIAYTYFKRKEYATSINAFKNYAEKSNIPKTQKNDAYLRLGDSYFVTSDYWSAMEAYNKAIAMKGIDSDYAYFQKAISYGFVDKNDRKIEDLEAFLSKYNKSIYRDDAYYELGNTYVATGNTQKAIQSYNKLINEQSSSSFVSKALLKQGLIYYNNDQGAEALQKFKKVVQDYPGTEEANQAVKTARVVYVDLGRTDEYASWVSTLDFVEVSDSDIDNATYEAAENQFIENNTTAAKKGFKKYLNDFPNGLHALSAHFYLGQLQFRDEEKDQAIPHYKYVVEQSRSEFTEQALARLSQLYLENKNYQAAIPVLKRLEQEADFPQNITFAQSNLMKAYYQLENYENTVKYAEKVLQDTKIENNVKSDAQVFIARSAIKTGDEARAKTAYQEVKKIATGSLAAEAQYYDAYFKRKEGNFEASNEAAQILARDYSGYKKWGAKGLLLMGQNFYDLDDAYQATYILDALIENFQNYPDVIEEAKAELARIKSEQAETNSSVEAEQN